MRIDWHFAVQQFNLSELHFETDTHILGRCISCYKNRRGAEYCWLVQQHKAIWATTCCECEQNGNSVTKCREELHHDDKMHSTWTKLPQQGQNSHNVAWNYKVSKWSAIPQDLEKWMSHTWCLTVTATGKIGFNDSLYSQDVDTQFTQESRATRSQGRQEWRRQKENSSQTLLLDRTPIVACMVVQVNSSHFALGKKIAQLDNSDVKQICRCDSWMCISNGVQFLEIQIPMTSAQCWYHVIA